MALGASLRRGDGRGGEGVQRWPPRGRDKDEIMDRGGVGWEEKEEEEEEEETSVTEGGLIQTGICMLRNKRAGEHKAWSRVWRSSQRKKIVRRLPFLKKKIGLQLPLSHIKSPPGTMVIAVLSSPPPFAFHRKDPCSIKKKTGGGGGRRRSRNLLQLFQPPNCLRRPSLPRPDVTSRFRPNEFGEWRGGGEGLVK